MAPVRLRHPGGITTIEIPFDSDSFTINDLQQQVYLSTDIPPSRQELKAGYPPVSLTVVPELPLSSLGLKRGDQIIVALKEECPSKPAATTAAAPPSYYSSTAKSSSPPTSRLAAPARVPKIGPDSVDVDGSVLVHQIVPDDNSCLFSAIALIFKQDISKASEIRQIVADGIKNNPVRYNAVFLGHPPEEYIALILQPRTWGGAIELSLLAKYFNTEIDSVDIESGRIDRFEPVGNPHPSGNRCIVIYSGIHYDAATLAPMKDAPAEWHQTIFPITNRDPAAEPILVAAKKLAAKLRERKAFTNTATFSLKCEECGEGLKGEKDARAHAQATGHVRFGEY